MASTLGRGLGSLLGEEAVSELEKERVREVPLEQIIPNVNQPREIMNEEALRELADSIRDHGVLQPILVRQWRSGKSEGRAGSKTRYELVAGERRWRASKMAGLSKIPVLVRDWGDDHSLEVAILENIQREELNPIDTARGYESLIRLFGYSHKKVGHRIGKSRMAVSNSLRLLKLPERVLEMVSLGDLSMGHGRALLGMEQGDDMVTHLAERIVEEGLSVRDVESIIRKIGDVEEGGSGDGVELEEVAVKGKGGRRRDPMIVDMENRLRGDLATDVSITYVEGKGKIIIDFDNPEKLESLTELLLD